MNPLKILVFLAVLLFSSSTYAAQYSLFTTFDVEGNLKDYAEDSKTLIPRITANKNLWQLEGHRLFYSPTGLFKTFTAIYSFQDGSSMAKFWDEISRDLTEFQVKHMKNLRSFLLKKQSEQKFNSGEAKYVLVSSGTYRNKQKAEDHAQWVKSQLGPAIQKYATEHPGLISFEKYEGNFAEMDFLTAFRFSTLEDAIKFMENSELLHLGEYDKEHYVDPPVISILGPGKMVETPIVGGAQKKKDEL